MCGNFNNMGDDDLNMQGIIQPNPNFVAYGYGTPSCRGEAPATLQDACSYQTQMVKTFLIQIYSILISFILLTFPIFYTFFLYFLFNLKLQSDMVQWESTKHFQYKICQTRNFAYMM